MPKMTLAVALILTALVIAALSILEEQRGNRDVSAGAPPTVTPTKQPSPGDTDGDGCPDQRENGPDAYFGGQRDFLYPWDYLDPTGDGFIRTDDLLGVIEHYAPTGGPPYDVTYDLGPILEGQSFPWVRTAPDGVINLVDDILGVLLSYHMDCSTPPLAGPTPTPSAGLAFSIGVDTNGDQADDCDTRGGPTKCILLDYVFSVNVYLDSLPASASGYEALATSFSLSGISEPTGVLEEWDDCESSTQHDYITSSTFILGCVTGLLPPIVASTYTGLIGTVEFSCSGDGSVSLLHGAIDTAFYEDASTIHVEGSGTSETLTINCDGGTPSPTPTPTNTNTPTITNTPTVTLTPSDTPTPTETPTPKDPDGDTDGDGVPNSSDPNDDNDSCTDAQELGPDQHFGGRRDPHNPWDFYDVSGITPGVPDGFIDLLYDVLGVIDHYAPNGTEPEYDAHYDRGPPVGPSPWNLTAPDGKIDLLVDVLGVINQFGHDCR